MSQKKSMWFLLWEHDFEKWLLDIGVCDKIHYNVRKTHPYAFDINIAENEVYYKNLIIRYKSTIYREYNKRHITEISITKSNDFGDNHYIIVNKNTDGEVILQNSKTPLEDKVINNDAIIEKIGKFICDVNPKMKQLVRNIKLNEIIHE